eukprot:15266243-Alexandrium_andersonii.AAC.1
MVATCRSSGANSRPGSPRRCQNVCCHFRHGEEHEEQPLSRLPPALQHLAASRELGIPDTSPHGAYMKR